MWTVDPITPHQASWSRISSCREHGLRRGETVVYWRILEHSLLSVPRAFRRRIPCHARLIVIHIVQIHALEMLESANQFHPRESPKRIYTLLLIKVRQKRLERHTGSEVVFWYCRRHQQPSIQNKRTTTFTSSWHESRKEHPQSGCASSREWGQIKLQLQQSS